MSTTTIAIRGMHCASCEVRVRKELLRIPGVQRADVSSRKGRAVVHATGEPDLPAIHAAIERAGYTPADGNDDRAWVTTDGNAYAELLLAAFIVGGVFLVARITGVLDMFTQANGPSGGIAAALVFGLIAGVSTCMALVGGIVLGVAARHAQRHPEASALQEFQPHLFFGIGRLVGFTVLGGALGMLGTLIVPSAFAVGSLSVVIGAVMLLMGLQLTGIFPRLDGVGVTLPSTLADRLGLGRLENGKYSDGGAALLGALTFFLPCGFTQMMQATAVASGSAFTGALLMGAFALGTAPGLLGIGALASTMHGNGRSLGLKVAGLLVIAFGAFTAVNGYQLAGGVPLYGTEVGGGAAVVQGVQVIAMEQNARGYTPNTFTVKQGIPVRWEINSKDPYSCAASLSVPSLGISKFFDPGLNVIEFTPDRTGDIRFTCAMGMFAGRISVTK